MNVIFVSLLLIFAYLTANMFARSVFAALPPLLKRVESGDVQDVLAEIDRARVKFPRWPTDPIHAAAVVAEESGELVKAVNESVYEPNKGSRDHIRKEAIHTAAMCFRFLSSLDKYEYFHATQHDQSKRGGE